MPERLGADSPLERNVKIRLKIPRFFAVNTIMARFLNLYNNLFPRYLLLIIVSFIGVLKSYCQNQNDTKLTSTINSHSSFMSNLNSKESEAFDVSYIDTITPRENKSPKEIKREIQYEAELSLGIISNIDEWKGITTIRKVSAGLSYEYKDLYITASAGLYKYDYLKKSYDDISISATILYQVNRNVEIGGYGNYSVLSKYNSKKGTMLPSNMVPYTSYGVYGKVFFTKYLGIEGTIGKEYNPYSGRWEQTHSVGPSIRIR